MIRLNAKQLRVFAKTGYTVSSLCHRLGCSEEDLKKHINQIYRNNPKIAQQIISELEGNRKIAHKESPESIQPDTPSELNEVNPTEAKPTEIANISNQEGPSKEDLELQEKTLSNEVMALETEHKALAGKHRNCSNTLRRIQDEIDEIKNRLDAYREQYKLTIADANEIALAMNSISLARREKMVALEAVRQQLDELKTVTLFVYADGRIEAPDHPDFVLDDEGYLELSKELSERPECFDLRIRDIQTLARLLKISAGIEKLALVCEIVELETAFLAIKGA